MMCKIGCIVIIRRRAKDGWKTYRSMMNYCCRWWCWCWCLRERMYAVCMLTYTSASCGPGRGYVSSSGQSERERERVVCNVSFPSNQYAAINLSDSPVINRYFLLFMFSASRTYTDTCMRAYIVNCNGYLVIRLSQNWFPCVFCF